VSDWYETKIEPAFRGVVEQAMRQCLNQPSIERPPRVDLVFVVTMSGRVSSLYWKKKHHLLPALKKAFSRRHSRQLQKQISILALASASRQKELKENQWLVL
jgi:hypothetical protein